MKIVISIFCLPYEIDELEQMLIQLKRASHYLSDLNEWTLDVSLGVSDYLVNWNDSKLKKDYFLDKFYKLEELSQWAWTEFSTSESILGCVSQRRHTSETFSDADYFIWLDTDIIFDERTLVYVENTIKETICEYPLSIITPEVVKLWDNTWDCLVNKNFMNKPHDYQKTNDPYKDCGVKGNISVETVHNNIQGQPRFKFAGGWFTCLSGDLLRKIGIPKLLGHYGLEDTFIMHGSEMLIKQKNETIVQFKIKNLVVCENYKYRDNKYLTNQLEMISRKDEFLKIAHDNVNDEMEKLLSR